MRVKCDRCQDYFETEELRSGPEGEKYLCSKCQFDSAVNAGLSQPRAESALIRVSPMHLLFTYHYLDLFKNPLFILLALAGGVLLGLNKPKLGLLLGPVGVGYLTVLKMCVFPVLITGVIAGVGKLIVVHMARKLVWRIISVLIVLLLFAGLAGLAAGHLGKPGLNLSREERVVLGRMLTEVDKSEGLQPGTQGSNRQWREFLRPLETGDVFGSFSLGLSVEILFFALILGIATGFLPEIEGRLILSLADSLYKAFFGIINGILYLLPLGLFCLVSGRLAGAGLPAFKAMTVFVATVYLACLSVFILSGLLIRYGARVSFGTMIRHLKESLLIGLGTQSGFASLPSQMSGLKKLGVNPEIADLVASIGTVACHFGLMVIVTLTAVFGAQLYGIHLGPGDLGLILVISLAVSITGAGLPTLASLSMISIVLDPLDLPAGPVLVLLVAVYPFIEPVASLAGVQTNLAAVCLIARGIKSGERSM